MDSGRLYTKRTQRDCAHSAHQARVLRAHTAHTQHTHKRAHRTCTQRTDPRMELVLMAEIPHSLIRFRIKYIKKQPTKLHACSDNGRVFSRAFAWCFRFFVFVFVVAVAVLLARSLGHRGCACVHAPETIDVAKVQLTRPQHAHALLGWVVLVLVVVGLCWCWCWC